MATTTQAAEAEETNGVSDREFIHAVARAARQCETESEPDRFFRPGSDRYPLVFYESGDLCGTAALNAIRACGGNIVGVTAREKGELVVHTARPGCL